MRSRYSEECLFIEILLPTKHVVECPPQAVAEDAEGLSLVVLLPQALDVALDVLRLAEQQESSLADCPFEMGVADLLVRRETGRFAGRCLRRTDKATV